MNIPANSKWYYPSIQEYGRKKGASPMTGHFYMLRAWDRNRSKIPELFAYVIWEGTAQICRQLGLRFQR